MTVQANATGVAASTTLQRGHIISRSDLKLAPKGAAQDIQKYIGKEMRRTIYAGSPLNSSLVSDPILVRRNARVSMIYSLGRMEITASGRALEAGANGDTISIMNLDSRQRVTGRVRPDGSVEVSP